MKTQKQIWEEIANEWQEFKKKQSILAKEFLEKQKGKILDLGSGAGRHLTKIKNGEMYLVDFSEKMIELARGKAKKEKISAKFSIAKMSKLPFKNNFFDSAICISSLHCIEKSNDRLKTIKGLHRVLKSKSKVLIAVWNKNSPRFKKYKTKERLIGWKEIGKRYYYLYDEKEIHDLFKKQGFKIIETQNSPLMIRFIAEKD